MAMEPETLKMIEHYIDIERQVQNINESLSQLLAHQRQIGKDLTGEVPEAFVFQYGDSAWYFWMDVDDGGVAEFREIDVIQSSED